ncbi:MAG TPA: GYF domain-containing protein [Pirellulales bacterium]|nr:GYF domain-containing protein [Pirellulales bacterium]
MGIKFTCPACGRPLNVKSELAGKRGRCPKCQAKIDIPAEGTAEAELPGPGTAASSEAGAGGSTSPSGPSAGPTVAAAGSAGGASSVTEETKAWPAAQPAAGDPIAEAPTLQWYAMPPGATNQYGPATGEEFRAWMQEGRIPADALVWRQDWPDWKRAGSVFPQLATPAPPAPPTAAAASTATAAMPTTPGTTPIARPAGTPAPIAPAAVAQPAFPLPGAATAIIPTAQASTPVAEGFPVVPTAPATTRSTAGRGRAYRPRSNTGPILAIVVLLLAMIPLTYFVWKVVSEQIVSPAPSSASSSDGDAAAAGTNEAAGSNEPDE